MLRMFTSLGIGAKAKIFEKCLKFSFGFIFKSFDIFLFE